MLSGAHYTILNAWLFKNDKLAVGLLLLVIMWPNDILHVLLLGTPAPPFYKIINDDPSACVSRKPP